jgi:hypothetical protein
MKVFYFISTLLFISCGADDFPEQSELAGLRVLAITADTPEINSASTVTLTPLISFVNGGNTTLDYSWEACPDPGVDFGAPLNCDSAPAAVKLSGSSTFSMATLSGSYYTGNATNISVAIPAAAFTYLSSLNSDIQFNGLDYIVFITYSDQASDAELKVIKRIKLSTKAGGELNTNPSFGTILNNGSNLVAYPSSKGTFTISSPSSPQDYDLQTNVGLRSFKEDMFISWYSSTGEYLFNRTDIGEENTFTPRGNTGVFVAVYRDGRGGVATYLISF